MSAALEVFALVERWSGITVTRGGTGEALRRFLLARTRALGLRSLEEYVARLQRHPGDERQVLLNAVTVPHTWFCRDQEQLDGVSELLRTGFPAGEALDVWVAGAATGEEGWTLAMLAAEARRPVSVVGTDLNTQGLEVAREGRYGAWSTRELPPSWAHHFVPDGRGLRVAEPLRTQVTFRAHNLLDEPPRAPRGRGWHLISCRNVLIYFGRAAAERILEQLAQALAPGGWLVLGSADPRGPGLPGLQYTSLGGRPALHRPRLPLAPGGFPTPSRSPVATPPAGRPMATPPARRSAAEVPWGPRDVADWLSEGRRLRSSAPDRATTCFERVLELDPLHVEARLQVGVLLHLSGDAGAAAAALRSALLLEETLWPAAFYLALSLETLGRLEEARREYQRVLDTHAANLPLHLRGAIEDIESFRVDVTALARRRVKALALAAPTATAPRPTGL